MKAGSLDEPATVRAASDSHSGASTTLAPTPVRPRRKSPSKKTLPQESIEKNAPDQAKKMKRKGDDRLMTG